jgi:predicted DsbA family dithiol-disulfide isomerase
VAAGLARELGLDDAAFRECVAATRHDQPIADDVSAANAVGISGTPTFVLGRSDARGVEGQKVIGAQPVASFEERIQALLAAAK